MLPTITNGRSTCITTTSHLELLPSSLRPPGPSPSVSFPEEGSKPGLNAMLVWHEKFFDREPEFYQSAFPLLDAFRVCTLPVTVVSPLVKWITAELLTETSISHEENVQSTEASLTQDSTSGASITPPTVDASPTPTSAGQENDQSAVPSTKQGSGPDTTVAPPTADPNLTSPVSNEQNGLPTFATQDPGSVSSITPTVDANHAPTNSREENGQPPVASTTQDSSSEAQTAARTVDVNPTSTSSREENDQSPIASTTQGSGSGASNAPPAVDVNPAPFGSSSFSAFATPIVTPSLSQQESTGRQSSSFPASNILVGTPSTTQEQGPISISAQSIDLGTTSTSNDQTSPGPSSPGASKESPSKSAAVADSVPAAPASLSREPANTPLSNQIPTNSIPTLSPPTLTIGSGTFTANSATQFEIAPGITVAPGGPAQTVSGTTISLAPSAYYIAVNDVTSILAVPAVLTPTPSLAYPVLTIGGSAYTANSATQYEIAPGITVAPGGPAQTLSGTIISLAPSASYIAVNGAILTLPAASTPEPTMVPPVLTIGGSTYIANSATQYEIAPGITVAPGGPAQTVSGTTISLAPSASYVAVNDVTSTLAPVSPARMAPPVLTIGSSAYTANSATQYEIAPGITVVPGGPAETISGTTISLAPSASYVAVNGVTLTLEADPLTSAPSLTPPTRTFGGSTYTAQSGSQYIIEGQTLGLGSSITIDSDSSTMVVELQTATNGATELIVSVGNSMSTSTLTSAGAAISLLITTPTKAPPPLTVAGNTYSANSLTQYSLAPDLTLTLGGVVTLGGTEISLASSGSFAIIGSSTETLSAPETTMTPGVGTSGSITNGLTGGGPSSSPASVNGAAGRMSQRSSGLCWMWLIGIIVANGYFGIL